jgi:cell division protein FtsB
MPFIFLVVGLLGGGLVCLLVLNTILASGSFQLTSLQQANTSLAQRQQMLQQQIAAEESPGAIAAEARKLGMVPVRQPRFVNLNTGRINGSSGTRGAGR